MSSHCTKYRYAFVLLIGVCLVLAPLWGVSAETVRKPAAAGMFYPKEPEQLEQMIKRLTRKAEKDRMETHSDLPLKAMVMPHAGYKYSGLTAAHAAPLLKNRKISKIIIMAPDHRVGFRGAAISGADSYQTPLGSVKIHPDAQRLKKQYDFFRTVAASDKKEHAVEVILPFLQTWLSDFKIIPIVFGKGVNTASYADAIETVIDSETLLIVSTDLSHYLPYEKAVSRDRQTIEIITGLKSDRLKDEPRRACGWMPLLVLMDLAGKGKWDPGLIHYSNSGDSSGRRDKVVGYATIAFYGEKNMNENDNTQKISNEKGEILLEVARKAIATRLGVKADSSENLESRTDDPVFKAKRGTFVTLKINDQLRGCIGNLVPEKTLIEGVRDNAANAAFHDPRFAPLSQDEFENIRIEVSLLTEPQPLEYTDGQDLLEKIRPEVDGLIIRKGPHSATFLPQVWEQLPDKKEFLRHLCMKAGLSADEWKKGDLQILTYQVQNFEEKS